MTGEPITTIIGNLTKDPELKHTQAGVAVANLTIAATPRTFNRQTNEWVDGETLFMDGSVWREAAENAADSLTKGMRVIAQGQLKSRSFEHDGQKRTVVEMEIDEIGPSLKYANAKVNRTQRNGNAPTQQPPAAQSQPWGNQPANSQGWGNGTGSQGEAPF